MQTDATSNNTVSPRMLGNVGTCFVVHANERNCQHCWWSSKEAMHSGTVILAMHVHRPFHEANIAVVPCKRTQHVGPNNVACCWPTMLRPFVCVGRGGGALLLALALS